MRSFDALRSMAERAKFLGSEILPVKRSLGRISVGTIRTIHPNPPFSCSRWDGYCIVSSDTHNASRDNPVRLRIIEGLVITAGMKSLAEIKSGYCCAIMSGAQIPKGADAVVKFEDVEVKGGAIELPKAIFPGEGVFPAGSFYTAGEVILERRRKIKPSHVFRLAEAGFAELEVLRKPKIALFAIGDELIEPGEELVEASRYAGGQYFIGSIARLVGIEVIYEEILKDDIKTLTERFRQASLQQVDMIITVGGTGQGFKDIVLKAWMHCGGEIIFQGLPLIPGKSTAGGTIGDILWLALPGGAMGAVVSFIETLRVVGSFWYGGECPMFSVLEIVTGDKIERHPKMHRAVWGKVKNSQGMLIFLPNGGKNGNFWELEGYVLIEPGLDTVPEGSLCKFVTF